MAQVVHINEARWGATPEDWAHLDLVLGLTEDMLPVVSNQKATISPNSTMKAVGKTPSMYNGQRHAVGIPSWTQKRATSEEVGQWSKEKDYGICIQTRRVRAIDVDIDDAGSAGRVADFIRARCALPARIRDNSSKFLLAFELPGDFTKRKFKCEHGIIEFLATGQQFVAVGRHTSGVRYEWEDGLPDAFPVLTAAQFEDLWSALAAEFAVEAPTEASASVKKEKLSSVYDNDPLARFLIEKDIVKRMERDGRMHITCPWEDEHSSESSDSSTTYWPAHTGGYEHGGFQCLHAHCEHRTVQDLKEAIGYVDETLLSEFENLAADLPAAESVQDAGLPDVGDMPTLADSPKTRFAVLDEDAFLDAAPVKWLIKHVMPQAELAVMFGESGSGKSFLALDMAAAIAQGHPWRGQKVRKGRVVYIAAEGAGGFRNRIRAYRMHHQLERLGIEVIANAPNLLEKADAVDVAKAILAKGKADLVIIDTLAQTMPGGNENGGEDMGRALAHCKGIHRATGAMVVLIHHAGKDSSKGARGWSGLRAAADAELEVVRDNDVRALYVTKQKDGADGSEYGFRLQTVVLGLDEDDEEVTSCVVEHTDVTKAKRTPKGNNERIVMTAVSDLGISGDPIKVTELLDHVVHKMPHEDGKRDRRREVAMRAVESLIAAGYLRANGAEIAVCE